MVMRASTTSTPYLRNCCCLRTGMPLLSMTFSVTNWLALLSPKAPCSVPAWRMAVCCGK
ncbi:hypothetical protein D3C85_1420510 [compost metagenome]